MQNACLINELFLKNQIIKMIAQSDVSELPVKGDHLSW